MTDAIIPRSCPSRSPTLPRADATCISIWRSSLIGVVLYTVLTYFIFPIFSRCFRFYSSTLVCKLSLVSSSVVSQFVNIPRGHTRVGCRPNKGIAVKLRAMFSGLWTAWPIDLRHSLILSRTPTNAFKRSRFLQHCFAARCTEKKSLKMLIIFLSGVFNRKKTRVPCFIVVLVLWKYTKPQELIAPTWAPRRIIGLFRRFPTCAL